MKIQRYSVENTNNHSKVAPKTQPTPAFKAGGVGMLGIVGGTMQWIEDKGFLASFLIQDTLGMTAPRVCTGFLRDKEVTGQYNVQEGFEVLGREGLTGPSMMAVAPLMLLIAGLWGKSTSVNSQLIKRFGNSLKNIISKPEFDKSLLKNKDKFKDLFYQTNIREILANTLGKENVSDELVNKILKEVHEIEKNPRLKKSKSALIAQMINDLKYKTSSDLNMLQKVNIAHGEKMGTYSVKDTIDAMIKYSDDAIRLNKNLEKLNEAEAENIKNTAIGKRIITNVSTMIATLGVLAVLPKLYIRNEISPGARTAMQLKEAQNKEAPDKILNDSEEIKNNEQQKQGEVSFKGKDSFLSKFGKFISKHQKNEKISSELEYNGHNFTNTLMAGLSLFGLLLPRGLKAYRRAQVDENGKKDKTEIYEILIRDVTSSLCVVFAVPMLTRIFVSSYENSTGFVLMDKNRNMTRFKKILDFINPYSSSHVLTNDEISAIYNGIDSTEKMLNFCDYIDKNNGDLYKIITKSENADILLNDSRFNISSVKNLSKKDKNKKIIEFLKQLSSDSDGDQKVTDLMKGTVNKKKKGLKRINKIASFARGMNSIPAAIAMVIISPAILGWFIPQLTYANTRRINAKAEKNKNKNNKINTAA